MIYQCSRCRTKLIGHAVTPPAGWIVSGDLAVCGACHRRAIGRKG